MKIAVVANCQARPVNDLLQHLSTQVESVGIIIVHLAKNTEIEAHYDLLRNADIIFAQYVQPGYPTGHVTTSSLRDAFGDRIITWPNLFFAGQCPGLAYLTSSTGQRVSGPLAEYQFRPVFDGWIRGLSVTECLKTLRSGPSAQDLLNQSRASLDNLKERETALDVKVSDVIETEQRARRLFFTFNHPSSYMLVRLCGRLLAQVGLRADLQLAPELIGEPLGRIVPPVLTADAEVLGLQFAIAESAQGVEVTIEENRVVQGKARIYSLETLIETTYRALDAQRDGLDKVRFTPSY